MAAKTEPFDVGDEIVFYADFENEAGAAANPTDVDLFYRKPVSGAETQINKPDLSNPSTGRFEKKVILDEPGTWRFEFRGQGTVTMVRKGTVRVLETEFAYPTP